MAKELEISIAAEPIFHILSFTLTNSLLNSWIAVVVIVLITILIRRKKITLVPRGIHNAIEMILEQALNLADSVTGSREKSIKFLPIVLPLFTFIMINNWLGLVPGVGSFGFFEKNGGNEVFTPLLRGATADLNTTLALAVATVILTHVFGVLMTGAWSHFNKFVRINLFLELPRKVFKEKQYMALLINPINFFVGLVEVAGEFAKMASLSLRLFGNIFAGEVLMGAIALIFAYILPIPFIFLEILVGAIQALIFSILALVFMSIMSTDHAHEH